MSQRKKCRKRQKVLPRRVGWCGSEQV